MFTLDSRQMGKSSLCIRALVKLNAKGIRTAFLDLTKFGVRNITPDQWFIAMLRELGRGLGLSTQLLGYWRANTELAPVQRFFGAIQDVALSEIDERIAIFIDEIDVTRSLPFDTDEFFAGIRQCYVGRATHPNLQRLTFSLFGTATPTELIKDTRVSPFNIGRRVELEDFRPEEAKVLAEGLPGNSLAVLRRILNWTGGHPYLTQRLCQQVASSGSSDVDGICRSLFLERRAKESDDNLAFVRDRILKDELDVPSILELYADVRSGKKVKDDPANPICSVLRMAGITRVESGLLKVRNRIYAQVFDIAWVNLHMPDAEERRRRAAYWSGVLRAAVLGGASIIAVGCLAAYAFTQARIARSALTNSRRLTQNLSATEENLRNALGRTNSALGDATRSQYESRQAAAQAEFQRGLAKTAAAKAAVEATNARTATELSNRRLSQSLVATAMQRLDSGDPAGAIAPLASALQLDANDPHRSAMNRIRLEYALRAASNLRQVWSGSSEMIDTEFLPSINGVLTVNRDGAISVWDVKTGNSLGAPMHQSGLASVALTRDLRHVISGNGKGEILIWDIHSRKILRRLRAPGGVFRLNVSDDGRFLAGASRNTDQPEHTDAWVWDLSDGRLLAHPFQAPSIVRINSLAFSPTGKRIIVGSANYIAYSVDLGDGFGNHPVSTCYNTNQAAFIHGGKGILINGASPPDTGGVAQVCIPQTGMPVQKLHDFSADDGIGSAFRISRDGESVLTATDQGTLQMFSLRTGGRIGPTIRSHSFAVDCDLSPDGLYAAVAGTDGSIRTWNIQTGEQVGSTLWHQQEVTKVRFDGSGSHLLTCSKDGTARLWIARTGGLVEESTQPLHFKGRPASYWTASGTLVASDMESTYRWDPSQGWKSYLPGYRWFFPLWNPRHRRGIFLRGDGIRVFDFFTEKFITPTLKCESGASRKRSFACLSSDERYLFDQYSPGKARIIDLDAGGKILSTIRLRSDVIVRPLEVPDERIGAPEMQFLPKLDRLIILRPTREIDIWSMLTGRLITTIRVGPGAGLMTSNPTGSVFTVYQQHDGIWTLSGFRTLDGHPCLRVDRMHYASNLLFSPSGDRLLESDSDRLWDISSGRTIASYPIIPLDHPTQFGVDDDPLGRCFFHPVTRAIHRFDTGAAITGPITAERAVSNSFSEDGRYLAVSTATSFSTLNLKTHHIAGPIFLGVLSRPVIAPKGELLAGLLNTRAGFWDPETGEQVIPSQGVDMPEVTFSFSPDGKAYSCLSHGTLVVRRLYSQASNSELLKEANDAQELRRVDANTWRRLQTRLTRSAKSTLSQQENPTRPAAHADYGIEEAISDTGLPNDDAASLLAAARAEANAGLWSTASETLSSARKHGAKGAGILFLEGTVALRLHRYAQAEQIFGTLASQDKSKVTGAVLFQSAVGNRDFKKAAAVVDEPFSDEPASWRVRRPVAACLALAAAGDKTANSRFESFVERCRIADPGTYEGLAPLLARSAIDLNAGQNRWRELIDKFENQDGDLDADMSKLLLTARHGSPLPRMNSENEPEQLFARALAKRRDGIQVYRAALLECSAKLHAMSQTNDCQTFDDTLKVLRTIVLAQECDRLAR